MYKYKKKDGKENHSKTTHFINNPYKRIFIYKFLLFSSIKACLHNDTTNVDHIHVIKKKYQYISLCTFK